MIDWSQLKKSTDVTGEQVRASTDLVNSQRLAAYRAESDQLKNEADFDAAVAGVEPDYSSWISKVKEIKERYPFP